VTGEGGVRAAVRRNSTCGLAIAAKPGARYKSLSATRYKKRKYNPHKCTLVWKLWKKKARFLELSLKQCLFGFSKGLADTVLSPKWKSACEGSASSLTHCQYLPSGLFLSILSLLERFRGSSEVSTCTFWTTCGFPAGKPLPFGASQTLCWGWKPQGWVGFKPLSLQGWRSHEQEAAFPSRMRKDCVWVHCNVLLCNWALLESGAEALVRHLTIPQKKKKKTKQKKTQL